MPEAAPMFRSLALAAAVVPGCLAAACPEDAMLVFDGSRSMANVGNFDTGESRIVAARRALAEAVPPISDERRVGFVVYGPGGRHSCDGLDLRFGPRADAAAAIIEGVRDLAPDGATALTEGVRLAVDALGGPEVPGTVVLVTDGQETCGGLPCDLAARLAGGALTVHVIGFDIPKNLLAAPGMVEGPQLTAGDLPSRCLADLTGGLYVTTEGVDQLVAALEWTLGCPLRF